MAEDEDYNGAVLSVRLTGSDMAAVADVARARGHVKKRSGAVNWSGALAELVRIGLAHVDDAGMAAREVHDGDAD